MLTITGEHGGYYWAKYPGTLLVFENNNNFHFLPLEVKQDGGKIEVG